MTRGGFFFHWTVAGPEKVAILDYHGRRGMTCYVTGMNGSIHAGEILLEEYQRPMGIS